jgi:hypothetical protein
MEGHSANLGVLCQNMNGFSNEVARIKVSLKAASKIDLENTAFLVRAQFGGLVLRNFYQIIKQKDAILALVAN